MKELPPRRSGMEPSHWKTSIFPLNLDKAFPPHWGRGQTIEHRRSGFPYLRAIPQKNLKYFRGVYLSATASELKQQLFRVRLCMLRSGKIFPQILRWLILSGTNLLPMSCLDGISGKFSLPPGHSGLLRLAWLSMWCACALCIGGWKSSTNRVSHALKPESFIGLNNFLQRPKRSILRSLPFMKWRTGHPIFGQQALPLLTGYPSRVS